MFENGIAFQPSSEAAARLDTSEYGTTQVTEQYVAAQIERVTAARRYGRVPRGFWDHQDVYLLTGPAQRDPASFRYRPPIHGHVDELEVLGGSVAMAGWVWTDAPGLRLRVRAGDTILYEGASFEPRHDVASWRGAAFLQSGFRLTLPLPSAAADGRRPLVVVEAEAGELRRVLYAARVGVARAPGRSRRVLRAVRGRLRR